MIDGVHFDETDLALSPTDWEGGSPPEAHASRPMRDSPDPAFKAGKFIEWLPRLGPVLWLQRRGAEPDRHSPMCAGSTLLLDHPAIGILSACTALQAHHVITPQGPREWVCVHASSDAVNAKLFLLPDSDVLAWDQMCSANALAADEPAQHEPPTHASFLQRAWARLGHRWQARLLEFRFREEPWLSVLDAQPPLRISLLGIDVVRNIVRDEGADLISPPHLL